MDDFWRKEEKLAWLRENPISKIAFESIVPDAKHNWINQTDNDWDELIPIADKSVKLGRNDGAIFELFSLGVVTNRDDWVYDFSQKVLEEKIKFLIDAYNKDLAVFSKLSKDEINEVIGKREKREMGEIKWTRAVVNDISHGKVYRFDASHFMVSTYRPFVKSTIYFAKELNEMQYQMPHLVGPNRENLFITFLSGNRQPFCGLATKYLPNLALYSADPAQCLPIFRYDPDGTRHDNITDWAVEEFARRGASGLTKDDIFHYVYAVLHYPPYREKYEQNLKREFPRIPVYENALEWARLGKELMELHLNYETVEPFALIQKEVEPMRRKAETRPVGSVPLLNIDLSTSEEDTLATARVSAFIPKPTTKLRADKEAGVIEIDSHTSLEGIPASAWEYKLGNRSALEWVLDQYKERKPKDPTIAEKFNTYKFADYKDHVIDLLKRVCTVSVKTMEIVKSMPEDPSQNRER